MAKGPRRPRYRCYLITYDLTKTIPGDSRYRNADIAIANYGVLFRPLKQTRLLITDRTALRIRQSLEQQIGGSSSLLIVRVREIPQWRIKGGKQQREWKNFVAALEEHDVDIRHVEEETTGGVV